jgi:hypothetical protein
VRRTPQRLRTTIGPDRAERCPGPPQLWPSRWSSRTSPGSAESGSASSRGREASYRLEMLEEWSVRVGGPQGILFRDDGWMMGGADPRRNGYATGW